MKTLMTFVGCRVNLKIKLSNFTENYQVHFHRRFIKPPGRVKCGVGTIVKLCSEIGLNIVESTCSASSSRVCQSCGRKIFNTAELVQFIYSDQERNVLQIARYASKDQMSSSVVYVFAGQASSSEKEFIQGLFYP